MRANLMNAIEKKMFLLVRLWWVDDIAYCIAMFRKWGSATEG